MDADRGAEAAASEEPSDRDLLTAHVAGDPEAFGLLFGRHRDRLWAVALRTTGSREDAADALQDAMISAFRRADSYRGESAVTTWLHRIVVNACLDLLRRRQVRAADPLPDDLDAALSAGGVSAGGVSGRRGPATSPTGLGDPEAVVADAELRAEVQRALALLPADQRAALVLVDMHGYPVAEAARVLDCPPGTVKSRCARGRTRLAALLGVVVGEPSAPRPATSPGNRAAAGSVQEPDEEVR